MNHNILADIGSENSVLGGILTEPSMIYPVMEFLSPDDFYNSNNSAIYESMLNLLKEKKPIDIITVSDKLAGKISSGDIASLLENSSLYENAKHHAAIVRQWREKRDLAKLLNEASESLHEGDIESIKSLIHAGIKDGEVSGAKGISTAKDGLEGLIERISEGDDRKIFWNFRDIDASLGGFNGGDLILLSARPSMGKTALALQVLINVSLMNKPCGMFSFEMSKELLTKRMLQNLSRKTAHHLDTGEHFVPEAMRKIEEMKYLIVDQAGLSTRQVVSISQRMKRESDIQFLIIDYLGLIRTEVSSGNVSVDVGEISFGLKSLARDLDIPILALHQVNRACELRMDKRPLMADLRDSGRLEQDADLVMFLYWDGYYSDKEEDQEKPHELICRKNRNGPTFLAYLNFEKEFQCFKDFRF